MTQLQVELVNPRAERLLQELAAMDLIVIRKPKSPTKDVEITKKLRRLPPHLQIRKLPDDIISLSAPTEDWDCLRECE